MKAIKAVRGFFKELYEGEGWLPCAIIIALIITGCVGLVHISCLLADKFADELSIPDKQGTYVIEDDGEIQVYVNDGRYKYRIDPISGYVNLVDSHSSVTTNMTEKEFFKSLEDKGLRKEGD